MIVYNPTVSVVTGTYNRLGLLQRMIESVRTTIPKGIAYEIVIVDGGSTDGTQDFIGGQADCRLVEHNELRGAIQAFGDGATTARGTYVLLANDDITFAPLGIAAAVSYLERHPTCGAVAFADNRTSLVSGDGRQYRTEGIGATLPDGSKTMVTYAQVGLFRKWLGDQVGWWGHTDPIMAQARTYGGDSYLSSCIWELGYTVDPVPQCIIHDTIARDELRSKNNLTAARDSGYYYQRYPTVHLPGYYTSAPDHQERMRILYLPIYESGFPQSMNTERGMTEALQEYGLVIEWDYLNDPVDLVQLAQLWQPHLLLTQIQGTGDKMTPYILASMRAACPHMLVVNWNGDAHEEGLTGKGVLELLEYVDIQTVVNSKVLPTYADKGIQASYWQIGYKDPVCVPVVVPSHDILFQGNCYNSERDALVRALRGIRLTSLKHPDVGVYGNCKNSVGNTHYNFGAQTALYKNATITIGDTYPNTEGFVSNRLFQALAAGAFVLQEYSKDLGKYTGLIPGTHYIEWYNHTDLQEKIVYYLDVKLAGERRGVAMQGQSFVRENFSYTAQVRKLFEEIIPQLAVRMLP